VSVYLDASVIIPKLVEEPETAAVEAYLAGNPEDRLVSDFAAAEVASVLSRLLRMGQLSLAEASAAIADFEIWRASNSSPVEVHAGDVRLAYAHVHRFDLALRAPDALHLAIARRTGAKLVSFDRRLLRAASALGIMADMPTIPSGRIK
jgi:predicted nucleic acid-binding protein